MKIKPKLLHNTYLRSLWTARSHWMAPCPVGMRIMASVPEAPRSGAAPGTPPVSGAKRLLQLWRPPAVSPRASAVAPLGRRSSSPGAERMARPRALGLTAGRLTPDPVPGKCPRSEEPLSFLRHPTLPLQGYTRTHELMQNGRSFQTSRVALRILTRHQESEQDAEVAFERQ